MTVKRDGVRLAELVAALSLGIDLGFGQPMEHVLRQTLIALALAERMGLDETDRAAVYYSSLLVNVGCHTDAHEQAKWFGDDIALKSGKYDHEIGTLREVAAGLRLIGSGNPPLQRIRVGLEFAVSGAREISAMISHHAQLAQVFAQRLSLPASVINALGACYEQWDGRGTPGDLAGEQIPIEARIVQFAEFIEVALRTGGLAAATEMANRRGGKQFDPALSRLICTAGEHISSGLDTVHTWDSVIESEPALAVVLSPEQFDSTLVAIADFVDLKSPYTLGHSRAVAELASNAGERLGVPSDDVRSLFRAGLISGFGRLGISNAIWDKAGPLGMGEWERVRMHPYLTERMLARSDVLAPLGRVAAQFRERMDGSGYPRGLAGSAISTHARILAAADSYQAMCEPRPHRLAMTPELAAQNLRAETAAGRFDPDAVEAVLGAAGHRTRRRIEGPAGLTAREIEVLRLVARGLSNKQIADELVISKKTVGNHVEHVYTKIDANSRAAAGLFAMQNGLLPE